MLLIELTLPDLRNIAFQMWADQKLTWSPEEYGGVEVLYVPADLIW